MQHEQIRCISGNKLIEHSKSNEYNSLYSQTGKEENTLTSITVKKSIYQNPTTIPDFKISHLSNNRREHSLSNHEYLQKPNANVVFNVETLNAYLKLQE